MYVFFFHFTYIESFKKGVQNTYVFFISLTYKNDLFCCSFVFFLLLNTANYMSADPREYTTQFESKHEPLVSLLQTILERRKDTTSVSVEAPSNDARTIVFKLHTADTPARLAFAQAMTELISILQQMEHIVATTLQSAQRCGV